MNSLNDKDKARKKFEKTGRGRRQDHGTRGTDQDSKSKDPDWIESANKRRDLRHGAEEEIEIEEE